MINSLLMSGITVLIFRDDLNHTTVSGNKLHKLAPNIELAQARNCNAILSFGGPYSNHLHALAWACNEQGLASTGVIRGELHKNLTPTLKDCVKWGMRLVPCQRKDYRKFREALSLLKQPCLDSETGLPPFSDLPETTLVLPDNKVASKARIESPNKIKAARRTCLGENIENPIIIIMAGIKNTAWRLIK